MMACEIEERMSPDEVVYWIAYFELKDAKMKEEDKKAAAKAKNSNPVSRRLR